MNIEDLFFLDLDSHPIDLRIGVQYEVVKTVVERNPFGDMRSVERRHLLKEVTPPIKRDSPRALGEVLPSAGDLIEVELFKPSGKYYTTEQWEVPKGAIGPYDMRRSESFRRIDGGAVLVTSQGWGYPQLFPGHGAPAHGSETASDG